MYLLRMDLFVSLEFCLVFLADVKVFDKPHTSKIFYGFLTAIKI